MKNSFLFFNAIFFLTDAGTCGQSGGDFALTQNVIAGGARPTAAGLNSEPNALFPQLADSDGHFTNLRYFSSDR